MLTIACCGASCACAESQASKEAKGLGISAFEFLLSDLQTPRAKICYSAHIYRILRIIEMVLEEYVPENRLKLLLQPSRQQRSIRQVFASNTVPVISRCRARLLPLGPTPIT